MKDGGRSATEVLALPVKLHGIQLGRPLEALLQLERDCVLGFEVLCGDGAQRFLPFSVARIERGEIALHSALTLIDEPDADYYRRHARRLSDLGYRRPLIDHRGNVRDS
jgi:hypothetical protein